VIAIVIVKTSCAEINAREGCETRENADHSVRSL